jgi:hypothetical protein
MNNRFSRRIAASVRVELKASVKARATGRAEHEFACLERAHVLGQGSTYWHVRVHLMMLMWGLRHSDVREIVGQIFRILGAATKTVFGLVPEGNTGGANVNPFRSMEIDPELAELIQRAKSTQ